MANPSRWAQWVITESANPRIPMPWTLTGARRLRRAPTESALV